MLLPRSAVILKDADIVDAGLAFAPITNPPHDLPSCRSVVLWPPILLLLLGRAAPGVVRLHLPQLEHAVEDSRCHGENQQTGKLPFPGIGGFAVSDIGGDDQA